MSPPGAVHDSDLDRDVTTDGTERVARIDPRVPVVTHFELDPRERNADDSWQLEALDHPAAMETSGTAWLQDLRRQVLVLPPLQYTPHLSPADEAGSDQQLQLQSMAARPTLSSSD